MVYIKHAFCMKIDHVESLYFGLSSSEQLQTKNNDTKTCVIDYRQSGKVASYIGGEVYFLSGSSLSSFNFTNKLMYHTRNFINLSRWRYWNNR